MIHSISRHALIVACVITCLLTSTTSAGDHHAAHRSYQPHHSYHPHHSYRSHTPDASMGWTDGGGYGLGQGYPGFQGGSVYQGVPFYGTGSFGPGLYGPGSWNDAYRSGRFQAPDLLDDPFFRAQHKFDSHFPGRYSRKPRLQLRGH